MSAHEPLPAALAEAVEPLQLLSVQPCERSTNPERRWCPESGDCLSEWCWPCTAERSLSTLRAAWPAVRRELLAEVERDQDEAMTALRALHHWCSDLYEGLEGPTGEGHIMESVARLISGEGETGGVAGDRSLDGRQDDRRYRPRSPSPDLAEVEEERVIPSALRAAMSASENEPPLPATAERVEEAVRKGLSIFVGIPEPEVRAAILFSLRRLHFGAVAGEIRARAALEEMQSKHGLNHPTLVPPRWRQATLVSLSELAKAALAQPASEPAAALEALLGELEVRADTKGDLPLDAVEIAEARYSDYIARRLRKAVGWEVNDG